MRLLGHYVEVACKGDISAFLSSGFVAALSAVHIAVQPVSVPYIVAVDQGSSGQLVVTIKAVAKRPKLRTPLRAGPRRRGHCQLDNDNGPQRENGNDPQQLHTGRDIPLPGPCLWKTGVLRREHPGGKDVHLARVEAPAR